MADAKYTPGRFVWHELFTKDIEASTKFYGKISGWTIKPQPMGEMTYNMVMAGEQPVAGLMDINNLPMKDVPPHWLGYVSVPDVKEAAAGAKSGGGKVLVEPTDIGIGTFAVIQDPQGAVVAPWRAVEGDPPEVDKPGLGTLCWDSISTTDPDAAAKFYEKVFGWQRTGFEGGGDESWTFLRGDKMAASMHRPPEGVPSHWMTYLVVDKLADARAKVPDLGGKVLMEEIPVPNIGKFAVITDNVGALVALFESP